ncbi:MAG: hypothetical protein VB064_06375 [Oscillospiraceae bacterium]|nr:hypothetical protein [Oscillospiraceae bacterium]
MKHTADICSSFIPPEITNHLWRIVDMYGDGDYVFVLQPKRLGDSLIQDISIETGNSSYHHTVLGFSPVNFTVRVSRKGQDLVMSIIPSEKALYEINKWKRIKEAMSFRHKKAKVVRRSLTLRKA